MEESQRTHAVEGVPPVGNLMIPLTADHLRVEQTGDSVGTPSNSSHSPRRSSKGAYATTAHVSLKPRSSDRSTSPADEQSAATSLESGYFGGSGNVYTLQPVDEGFGAWSYVASAFAMYIVVWGFPQAFPVFQTFLSSGPSARFPNSVIVRLLAPGLQDIEEGLLFQILPKASKHRSLLVIVGISIITLAMILASCASADWQVVLAQGVFFGIGGILLNFVHVSIFPEWFDKKKGQAMGIIWLGYRCGALGFPLICQWLLEKHGFEQTLRVLIAPMLVLLLPSIVLLRGRYHAATVISTEVQPRISKIQALQKPNVLFYLSVSLLFDFVVNVPKMFITTFAADINLKGSDQALALSLLVLSNMIGTYVSGWLSDRVFHEDLVGGIAISSSLVHFGIWGVSRTRFVLFLYAIAIGLASGGFDNCLFPFYAEVAGKDGELFTAVHSLFSLFSGIAILSVGPVGASILQRSPSIDFNRYAIGRYQYLVAYAGSMTMASGLLVFARKGLRKFYR